MINREAYFAAIGAMPEAWQRARLELNERIASLAREWLDLEQQREALVARQHEVAHRWRTAQVDEQVNLVEAGLDPTEVDEMIKAEIAREDGIG